jgi:outer membrane autotransporter protein
MALRMGTASGFDLAGLSIDIDGHRISGRQVQGLMEAFANGGAASADDSGFSRLGVFVSGRLSRGTRDETANVDGFKYRITGLTAGADYRLQDALIVGGALGYSRAKTDIRNEGGDVDADNYSATLYGTWYQDSGVFVDGSLTYSRGDFDQQRNVNYTLPTQGVTVDQIFDASFKGNTFGISLSGGYEFRQNALTLVPFARLQYLRARIDGYQETVRRPGEAGDGLGVEIDNQHLTSFTSALGVQANYAISQPWGVLMPFASAEWVHEFDKSNDNVTGRFLGDRGGNTFAFAIDDTDSNYFDLGVGVAAQFTQGTSGFVNYQRVEGFSNLSHYSVNAGLRFEF